MLHKIFLLTIMVLSLIAWERVQAQDLSWTYSTTAQDTQGKEKNGSLIYSVSSDITKIEDEKEITIIDYSNNVLLRYDKRSDECLDFPITTNHSPQLEPLGSVSKTNKMLSLSNFRLFSLGKHQQIAKYTCQLKRILFGIDFAQSQMVAPPTTYEFGQKFTESMVSYCVSENVVGFDIIFKIAKQHNALYVRNPFLRQIDLVGLFAKLHGFPVQVIKTVDNIKTTLSLIEEPQLIKNIVIPQKCR